MKKKKIILYICILLVLTFYISKYHFQILLIQGESMLPTYHPWQFTILEKKTSDYKEGDVVAIECSSLNTIIIKRIVATPGSEIDICDNILYVNGIPSTIVVNHIMTYDASIYPLTLEQDEFFVLGDNLEESIDSRDSRIGCIKKQDILGIIIPNTPIEN